MQDSLQMNEMCGSAKLYKKGLAKVKMYNKQYVVVHNKICTFGLAGMQSPFMIYLDFQI